jgi:hypothetical protein
VVETEGSKSDLVAPVWLDSDSTGRLSVSDNLSAGLFSLVCANCSGSFSIFPLWTFHLYVATFQQHENFCVQSGTTLIYSNFQAGT